MFRNYFTVAIRNLWRNKLFSIINVVGLSLGLACCILIFLYTKDEVSYDRFQAKKDQLFRITSEIVDKDGKSNFKSGKTGAVHGPAFKREIPEILDYVRISHTNYVVKKGNETFDQEALFVDDNFFSIFSFPLISGTAKSAFTELNSIVLTEDAAKKYFGKTDIIGQTLELQVKEKFQPFVVSAVARNPPENSSIKFQVLLPIKFSEKQSPDDVWLNFYLSTFLVLNPAADPSAVVNKMMKVYATDAKDQLREAKEAYGFNDKVVLGLQPMLGIHLNKDYKAEDELSDASSPTNSYILTGISIFLLLIACINFINLTVAQSLKRAKEIGIRKVVGGLRGQLIRQFLGESFILCFLAFSLGIVLASLALPIFNNLANKQLSISYLFDLKLVAGFIMLFILTGLAAGFYPALVLSGFNPVQTLYNRTRLSGKNYLSRVLVVLQFSLAIILITSTLFIHKQYEFLTNSPLGYNDKDLVVVSLGKTSNRLVGLFKNALQPNPGIEMVAGHTPGRRGTEARVDGKQVGFDYEGIDENYLPTLQVQLLQGRNFSPAFPADTSNSVIINEKFAKLAGWKDPIGQTIDIFWKKRKLTVIGLVKDFHFRSLKEDIGPEIFTEEPDLQMGKLFIKIKPNNIPQTLAFIQQTYKKLVPFFPYTYVFKKEENAKAYESEAKWQQIISYSAILTIFISCIGLFGLAALSAERRVKEIGIRKVLGASVSNILGLISSSFLRLVLLANIIAIPVAWWAVHKWLQDFPNRISISWWVFASAGIIALVIALFTVSFQAIKAALANPVKSLRTE